LEIEMPVATVTKIDKSQNNKDRVYLDNHHDWKDAYYVKQGLYLPAVGQVIEADTSSQEFRPGRVTWFLNQWKAVNSPSAAVGAAHRAYNGAPGPSPLPNSPMPGSQPISASAKGWDVLPGDLSRFVSNLVGSAISAKLIEKPEQIIAWTRAAYVAAQGMRDGMPDMNLDYDGHDPSTHAGDPDGDDDPEAWRDKAPF
jgi:hypothetical protein